MATFALAVAIAGVVLVLVALALRRLVRGRLDLWARSARRSGVRGEIARDAYLAWWRGGDAAGPMHELGRELQRLGLIHVSSSARCTCPRCGCRVELNVHDAPLGMCALCRSGEHASAADVRENGWGRHGW